MLPLSEAELRRREAREREDAARQLDKTVPGGVYINDAGNYVNAEGQYVDEHGKYVNEPVAAKDVQKRLEGERVAAIAAEASATEAKQTAKSK